MSGWKRCRWGNIGVRPISHLKKGYWPSGGVGMFSLKWTKMRVLMGTGWTWKWRTRSDIEMKINGGDSVFQS